MSRKKCDFVDIGDVKQSLSEGNLSWIFCKSVSLPSALKRIFDTSLCCFYFGIFISFKTIFSPLKLRRNCHLAFNTVQYRWSRITKSQVVLMTKIMSKNDCLFVTVSGPSEPSKADLFFQKLLRGTFFRSF